VVKVGSRQVCAGCGRELVDGSCPDCAIHGDPHGAYIRIFELVCRGPRHEARRLVRLLDDIERDAFADRLAVTAGILREET
jgi:hypothetical protein